MKLGRWGVAAAFGIALAAMIAGVATAGALTIKATLASITWMYGGASAGSSPALVYQGTTFVPIQNLVKVSHGLVTYDSKTGEVSISAATASSPPGSATTTGTSTTGTSGTVYLSDLKPYYASASFMENDNPTTDPGPAFAKGFFASMPGMSFTKVVSINAGSVHGVDTLDYDLAGTYKSLTFSLGMDQSAHHLYVLLEITSGHTVLLKKLVSPSALPTSETVNVTGVTKLVIRATANVQQSNDLNGAQPGWASFRLCTSQVFCRYGGLSAGIVDLANPVLTK